MPRGRGRATDGVCSLRCRYVFLVSDFFSAAECDALIAKAEAARVRRGADTLPRQLVGEADASQRTSVGCVATRAEVAGLRARIARLAGVGVAHLQPLKISCYATGARFAEHCDAVDGNGAVDDERDYYADAARARHGTRHVPHPGANRCCTVFVYLNDVAPGGGGRTRFRWVDSVPGFYDAPAPSGMRCTRLAPAARQLAIRPEKGLAVVHFPATSAATGGVTDRNASHESEAVARRHTTKWVAQQFIWSHPVAPDVLEGTTEPDEPLDEVVL